MVSSRELQDRLLAMSAHASIEGSDDRLSEWGVWAEIAEAQPGVAAVAPFITGQGLLVFGNKLSGAELRGIDPAREATVSGVGETMIEGDLSSLEAGSFNIVLGVELAEELQASLGDKGKR